MEGIIKPAGELWYPGLFKMGTKRRVICNLSSYGIGKIDFDIERTVEWHGKFQGYELLPFTYSFMINSYQPIPRRQKDIKRLKKEFKDRMSNKPGFILDSDEDDLVDYVNPGQHDILVDWINHSGSDNPHITIGVIQAKKLPELDQVIQSLPYAVEIFNELSPNKLEQEVVDRSIAIARQGNLVLPRCRFKEPAAYEAYVKKQERKHRR